MIFQIFLSFVVLVFYNPMNKPYIHGKMVEASNKRVTIHTKE